MMQMKATFFRANRSKLITVLSGGVAVLYAYGRQQRSNDAAHAFTQEANFWYLTGINEPDWGLIIDGTRAISYLVMPDMDEEHRIFDGGLSADDAQLVSGVDKVITTDQATVLLRELARRHGLAHTVGAPTYANRFNFALNPSLTLRQHALERVFPKVNDIQKDIAKLRAIKQPHEIEMIKKAVKKTAGAFELIHERMRDMSSEYEIEAEFSYHMRKSGLDGHAYDPIVAAGANACTLHYSKNSAKVVGRQLVLMDVGGLYGGYAADITRTYVKGEPTKRQRQVHAAVEQAHHRIIRLIEPMLPVESYQKSVDEIMMEAIGSVGLPSDETALRRYFPHAISHGLGIDVHDSLGAPKYFQENMVLTVEPGIYIPEEGIGVRIEDDILVTKTGRQNLSASLSTGL